MNKEKQIEEMAKVIASVPSIEIPVGSRMQGKHIYTLNKFAEALYNAGYRKQRMGENISELHPVDEFVCSECGLIMRDCYRIEIDEDDDDEICYEFAFKYCPRCGAKMKGE